MPSPARHWRRVLPTPRRLAIWSTPGRSGTLAARVVYQPFRARARLLNSVVAHTMPFGSGDASIPNIDGVLERLDIRYAHGAAVYAREPDRWIFALLESDTRGVVVKLGRLGDTGIRHEIETLTTLTGAKSTFRSPHVRWSGESDGWVVLVTDVIARDGPQREADLEDALSASCALAKTPFGFVVHGDLAPWNMVQTSDGIALVDWEESRFEEDPLFDLAHYVTRVGALRGLWKPQAAVSHLTAPGSVGWRYLQSLGRKPESAPEHVARYLRRREHTTRSEGLRRYESAMTTMLERAQGRVRDTPSPDSAS